MLNKETSPESAGVFALIATFRVRAEWELADGTAHSAAAAEFAELLGHPARHVDANIYVSRGLKASCDYFLRVLASDLGEAQDFLGDCAHTTVGRFSQSTDTLIGVTKSRRYISRDRSQSLDDLLNTAEYKDPPPRFAIVIPVKKDARWWNMPEEERFSEIEIHTQQSLPFLQSVKRELYHSTGLDDIDFVTWFEVADLRAFHDLCVRLASIRENEFYLPTRHAMLIGRILTTSDAVERLCGPVKIQDGRQI